MKTKIHILTLSLGAVICIAQSGSSQIGREVGLPRHLQNGEEYRLSISQLIEHGRKIFTAVWTDQEGGGRPFSKGTGAPLSDPSQPLLFPRNFNRVSGPDANSCAACHAQPFGIVGGHGDIVANVFVLGQRFDFGTFDRLDLLPTKGSLDELGRPVTLQSIANSRVTIGMFGSGFIEMLARQITHDLQTIRDTVAQSESHRLLSKGISYGAIARRADGTWDTSRVEGVSAQSLVSADAEHPPSLIIRPFHQAANRVSLRDFSNTAFNQHHGIQSAERFGVNIDADGDGIANELTRADMTAVTIFQATMAVPGRVIPNNPEIETAVLNGERKFQAIGCASCHVPALPLDNRGWVFTEPNPYNPVGNLRVGEAPTLAVDLTDHILPPPRLQPNNRRVLYVPAFTDMKLHDVCDGPDDANIEPLDMNQPAGSPGFFSGNRKFITKKLWGVGNQPPFFHHGQFTTMRAAILAHGGEARATRQAFQSLSNYDRDCIIEFLKTLHVLPPGTECLVCDENYHPKQWPPPGR